MERVLEYEILNKIESPRDIKSLSMPELERLAEEMRKYIIEVVSIRGGHLASSLGTVEMTLALHYVFDSPRDRIVWDVGHQSYTHKILTGRREGFKNLRTREGISGFPNIFESEYDSFGVGHACTAISAATGFVVARDLRGEDNFVISVVGDGSISGGMSLEGINHAGHLKKNKFVIILNDNEMSISKNVGALAKYLTRITTKKPYLQLEADVWELLGKIPTLGGKARKLARRIKESIKNLVVPTILFEELGFRYLGPLDGHDTELLIDTFSKLHQMPGPVLIHTVTKKGKGYQFAEEDAEKYHGVGSFYKKTGGSKSKPVRESYSTFFGNVMCDIASRDEKVVAVTAAMKEGTGLARFAKEYPDRIFDVGISEQHAVTFAAGLAREGFKPFVAIYSTFLQRGFDQVIHDVALQRLPVRFVLDRAGIVGKDGPTHNGAFDLSYLNLIPGMVIMAPSDENELSRMVYTMLACGDSPSAIRFPRGMIEGVEPDDPELPLELGKGKTIRPGGDVAFLSAGSMLGQTIGAAEILKRSGIEALVADARFIKPLDGELMDELSADGRRVFTVEENTIRGGLSDAVAVYLSETKDETRHTRIGLSDRFIPHGGRDELLREEGLVPEEIAKKVIKTLNRSGIKDQGGDR